MLTGQQLDAVAANPIEALKDVADNILLSCKRLRILSIDYTCIGPGQMVCLRTTANVVVLPNQLGCFRVYLGNGVQALLASHRLP